MFVFATTGLPGRLGLIHLDVIEDIRSPRAYARTNVALERGAPVTNHRQRETFQLMVTVLISDVAPIAIPGLWEGNHAQKTRDAIRLLQQLGTEVTFFDGKELWRTPSGSRVWTVDEIDDGKSVETHSGFLQHAWRATITLGEVARFGTAFTVVPPAADPSIADAVDGIADKGQQSTEAVPADLAATIPG